MNEREKDLTPGTRFLDEDDVVELQQLHAVDPRDFHFMKLSRRVCLIERDDAATATGFLVGPDLMLTAAHALRGTAGIFADPATVTIKFDHFVWNRRTGTLATGDQCRLRYIPFTNQPDVVASSLKVDPKSSRLYGDNELDYVLVRLDRPIGLSFLPYSNRIRGWNNCSRADAPALDHVIVVQHPLGELLQFADGFIGLDRHDPEHPQFFRYKSFTLNGSSGAPMHDKRGRIVGMHIGERAASQQFGVSFQAIFEDLRKEGVTLPPFRLTRTMMDSVFGSSEVQRERKQGKDWRGDRLFDDVHEA